jgi:mannose-6-phosphate isomerase-like protein (cupin superfamily)
MKTDKYIITKTKDRGFKFVDQPPTKDIMEQVMFLDNEAVKGAFYVETAWFWKATPPGPQTHVHDFDEVLAFFGTNPEDSHDLGGEVELWIDGEKHLITKSFIAFIPKGVKHCPLRVTKVDRPIFHFATSPMNTYGGDRK